MGWTRPPRPGAQDAVHDQPEAQRGQHGADQVQPGALLGRGIGHPAGQAQDAEHHQDFTGERPPPGGIGGEQAADQRPGGHRDGAGRRDQPVCARALITREVRRHQRDDRRHDQRGPGTFQHGPSHDQHGQIAGQRGGQRPAPVDDAADGEGALAAEDLAELAAGDHQRGHHQRVEGDRGLDPGHRRADVLGHGGDRHVHDRTVQRHQELRRGQCQQHDPGRGRRGLTGAARCGLSAERHPARSIQVMDNKANIIARDGQPSH